MRWLSSLSVLLLLSLLIPAAKAYGDNNYSYCLYGVDPNVCVFGPPPEPPLPPFVTGIDIIDKYQGQLIVFGLLTSAGVVLGIFMLRRRKREDEGEQEE